VLDLASTFVSRVQGSAFDPNDLDRRDPRLIARCLPLVRSYARFYVRLTVEGREHITNRPALFVANHNGGIFGPDLLCTLGMLWSALGPEAPLYALAHDFAMRQFTPLGRLLQKFGAVRAGRHNAVRIIERGGQILVYPGGDIEAYRTFAQRHGVFLGQRHGFLRVARDLGVPIVPIVAAGAHTSAIIVHDGAALARQVRLKHWGRLERFPIALCAPWGIACGPWIPYLPLPFKVRLRILPPRLVAPGESLEAAQHRVVSDMQRALTELSQR
jgi:1-acyl-sn-glycerol-3-phosphate acyltransferase